MVYKVLDLFAGVGGLSYGFAHDPAFQVVAANELLPAMARAYVANHPNVHMYNKDIKDFSIRDLTIDLGIKEGDIDIVVGGPPCQAYSTVGKRLTEDPRGKLFQEYYRVLVELKPKVFIFENVKGLLSMKKGALIKEIVSLFESIGYQISIKVLNAADFGTPQMRERVIIVGTLLPHLFEYPIPTHGDRDDLSLFDDLLPYVTLSEALGDLPQIEPGECGVEYLFSPQNDYQRQMRANAPQEILEHISAKHNPKLVALMKALPDGGLPKDLPEELRPKAGFPNSYAKLWWNRPSTTITRNLGCPSSARCIHPRDSRPLTTREGARLQGFPDDYIFCGSRSEKNLQIGNAVPTQLSIALKNAIKEHLSVR